jgi:hypothetical protein
VNRLHVARRVLRPRSSLLSIPKAVFYTAVAVMEMVPRFEKMLSPARTERFARNSNFLEAYTFMQILEKAGDVDEKILEQWKELHKGALKSASVKSNDEKENSFRRKRQHQGRSRRKRSKPKE